MGLTERHWFEDEEPELTENQLEDILWENNKIFERGYQKGFSDGKLAILREQEPVKPRFREMALLGSWDKVAFCGGCGCTLGYSARYCPNCGRPVEWEDDDGKANQKG